MGQGLPYNRATCTPPFFSPNHMLSTTPPVLMCVYVERSDVSGLCLNCSSTEWVINEMMITHQHKSGERKCGVCDGSWSEASFQKLEVS